MNVCPSCRELQDRWLHDTSPDTHTRPGIRFHSHASYDDTPAGMRANRTRRWEEWRDLVNSQRAAIAEQCARDHQAAALPPLPTPGPWEQYDLFGEAS